MSEPNRHPSARTLAAISCEEYVEEFKPLLRGWSHAVAAIGALVVTCALYLQTVHDLPRLVSHMIFGFSLIVLYVVSATYHIGRWQGRWESRLLAFDHANIFILIAGTYTPFCVNVLSGWLRPVMLTVVWGLAALGVACAVLTLRVPRWLLATMYIGMGWVALLAAPWIITALPLPALGLLLVGGLLYTIGAVIYMIGRPNLIPRLFGFHELFHLFVIGGSAATVIVIWYWVVPFPRA